MEDKLSRSKQACVNLDKQIKDLQNQLSEEQTATQRKEEEFHQQLKTVVAEKDLLLSDAEKINNDLAKGKDALQEMVLKLEEKRKKYKESIKDLGRLV